MGQPLSKEDFDVFDYKISDKDEYEIKIGKHIFVGLTLVSVIAMLYF